MKRLIPLLLAVILILPACTTETGGENMANYLTFSSENSFTISVKDAQKHWDGTLEYSTDGSSWAEWGGETSISSGEHDGKQCIYMRGIGNSKITGSAGSPRWVLTGTEIRCTGNIETLLDYETVADGGHPAMAAYCYNSMFQGCTSLVTAPSLPATTLAESCYYYMFYGCSSLVEAPALPATTLATNCYSGMFRGCTSLVAAPALPATTLADNCYNAMFYGCSSLTVAPMLPATTLTKYCYCNMFRGCTSLAFATAQSADYPYEYRIPTNGEGTEANNALLNMFTETGGTFTGTPEINTTLFAASDPVPAVSKLTISTGGSANGDGMALYNGVMLPKLPEYDGFSHQHLAYVDGKTLGASGGYILVLESCDSPMKYSDGMFVADANNTAFSHVSSVYVSDDELSAALEIPANEWLNETSTGTTALEPEFTPTWSNYDILNLSDGTVYLSASDPIPLDGMNVITWDGDTTGLTGDSFGATYKVSDTVLTKDELAQSYFVMRDNSGGQFGYVTAVEGNGCVYSADGLVTSVSQIGASGPYSQSYTETGTYFPVGGGDGFFVLLAYPASSGGSVTDTTATVNFSCTDLLYTDSVYRIKAWVYKVADGLDVTLAPTWTSDLFAGPSRSESHTFTGLTPATEYGIYAVIEEDGMETENTAQAGFTTTGEPEPEEPVTGFDHDAFCLGMASGFSGTGVIRAGGNHNNWLQGYLAGLALKGGT